jgi:hypothetical protein
MRDETLCFPEGFAHNMEEAWNHLGNISKIPVFDRLPNFRRKAMKDLSLGFRDLPRICHWGQ